MAGKPKAPRGKNKDNARRSKKKISLLITERVEYVDWKDVNLLRRFMSERGKIRARRVTGNCQQHQRDVAVAIKTAREIALLPYTQRTMTERGPRGGGRGGPGRGREDGGGGRDRAAVAEVDTELDIDVEDLDVDVDAATNGEAAVADGGAGEADGE